METVNNLASAASRAIWGEGNGANAAQTTEDVKGSETKEQEPVSGETGNVEAGEPYDKGNAEPASDTTTSTDEPKTSTLTSNPKSSTEPDAPGNTPATEPIRPEHDTDKTGVTSAHNPTSATSSDKPTSSNDNSGPGAASVSADPSSAPQNTQKQQGADRPSDEPSSEEHDRIMETKKEVDDAANVDTSGPGPRSLEDKARGGGVGGASGGDKEGEEDGPQKESHGEGTGEKYVKSSGLKADGGDFDASNPGAAKEADRLLEEKGIHHEPGTAGPPAGEEDVGGSDAKASKPKISERIKAKLHIGKDKD